MPRQRLIGITAVMLMAIGVSALRSIADAPAATVALELSAAQREAALEFAHEHHPQLRSLIRKLEKRDAAEYEKALTDLSRSSERLARQQSRDPQRYAVELDLWKVDSRIRLLAAQMANDDRLSLENQLRSLLDERADLRLQQISQERQRLTSRLERLEGQVDELTNDRQASIDKDVERLRKSVRSRTQVVSKRKAAANPKKQGVKAKTSPAQKTSDPPRT